MHIFFSFSTHSFTYTNTHIHNHNYTTSFKTFFFFFPKSGITHNTHVYKHKCTFSSHFQHISSHMQTHIYTISIIQLHSKNPLLLLSQKWRHTLGFLQPTFSSLSLPFTWLI